MKKRIAMILVIVLLLSLISMEAGAKVTNVGGHYTYTQGGVTVCIKDLTSGRTTTGLLKIKRNNTLAYLEGMCWNPSTWYCSLDIIGENYHNLRLNQNTVTTTQDPSYDYLAMNFSLSYTQTANYEYKEVSYEGDLTHFFEFTKYGVSNAHISTIPSGFVDTNTERTVNLGVSAVQAGLLPTWEPTLLYTDAVIIAEYNCPSYKVSFTDGEGKIIEEQTVLRGDNAKKPTDPSKEGYYFGGWDKNFSNIKENITVNAKWISKDGSNPPVTGDDALSAHTDLYDEAQTFYVPEIDTELVNPDVN